MPIADSPFGQRPENKAESMDETVIAYREMRPDHTRSCDQNRLAKAEASILYWSTCEGAIFRGRNSEATGLLFMSRSSSWFVISRLLLVHLKSGLAVLPRRGHLYFLARYTSMHRSLPQGRGSCTGMSSGSRGSVPQLYKRRKSAIQSRRHRFSRLLTST